MFGFLKPAPLASQAIEPAEVEATYSYWRFRIFYSLFIGYAFFYFTRKSFTCATPYLMSELNFTPTEIGFIGSVLYITYGISKFASGVISDRSNPRYFMATGLIITGILNFAFGMSSSFWTMAFIWGLNGWFQAWGWPACTKQLVHWFSKSERGLWYSICSTSHNVGGALIPLISIGAAEAFGWRYAMYVPAVMSLTMGLFLLNRLRDVPQTLGLPCVEVYKEENKPDQATLCLDESSRNLPVKDILFNQVLTNPYIWTLALTYFFVYFVRTAINDWSLIFLIDQRGYAEQVAKWGITAFEMGGLVGMIAAGLFSDYFTKGKRIPSMIIFAVGLTMSILGLWALEPISPLMDMSLLGLLGFFVFGPQMMVGLAAAEFVDKRAASTSNGFVGTLGYFGAATANLPIGMVLQDSSMGWSGFFACNVVASVIVLILLLVMCMKPVEKKQLQMA